VVVPEDQLSLAIGRDGQNARLAARLTSWRIDIKSLPEAAVDALNKLQKEPEYAVFGELEKDVIPQIEQILNKKAEGRPVTPEEYQLMSQFVDRVERGILRQREGYIQAEEERQLIAAANIPDEAFEIPLEDIGLPLRYTTLLNGAGYLSVGDLMLQLKLDPNKILALEGIGAKAMAAIEDALSKFSLPATEVAEEETQEEEQPIVEEAAVEQVGEFERETEVVEEVEEAPLSEITKEERLPSQENVIETEEVLEETPSAEMALVDEKEAQAAQQETQEEAEETSLDDLFKWSPDQIEIDLSLVAEDEDEETEADKKKKKKKKKYVEYEYDPDQAATIAKKKRKRSGEEWDDEWNL